MALAAVMKMSLRFRPSEKKAIMQASEMSAAISPYSMAVAPRSSSGNRNGKILLLALRRGKIVRRIFPHAYQRG